ncbi:polymer-forming cytoskeletal protein [Acanthopleuribacter pedis]|uniref:Polymer-forming cytoskeletal protein n=1 Tax=Acanthopleuribacter pedis TaxID=442870 RepID=A0A8J7QAK2_9BACT|nr:polymer-forming cytoskeletal protein [Acanthopleuribacter pedis]MBO1320104.1 polymer-forming cytoskeletal protein [Acanthopleuribacter pedis]
MMKLTPALLKNGIPASVVKLPILLLFWCLPALFAADVPVRVLPGVSYQNDLFSLGQQVIVEGSVEGDVSAVNGDVHVKGTISGNVTALNGNVTLYRNAEVGGNLVCIGGEVTRHNVSRLQGRSIHHFAPSRAQDTQLLHSFNGRMAFIFSQTFVLFLLLIGTFYIFPNQVNEAGFQLTQDPARHFVIGLVTVAAFCTALFFSVLLMVVLIGFPLFLVFAAGLTVVGVFGAMVVLHRLAQWLETLSGGLVTTVPASLLAVAGFVLLSQVPWVNQFVLAGCLVLGSGVVIETRFGTNKQWFTKKKRYWGA